MQQKTWRSLSTPESNSYSGVYIYLMTGIILLIAVFLFVRPASAQSIEELTPDVPGEVDEDVVVSEIEVEAPVTDIIKEIDSTDQSEGKIDESSPSAEVILDETVEITDLNVSDSQILPDSPWYGFKRFGRNLREAITFNPAKKIELYLQHASQELVDTRKLIEEKANDREAMQAVVKALSTFEEKVADLKDKAADLEGQVEGDRVVRQLLDRQIKQQKIFEHIEQQITTEVPQSFTPELIGRLADTRERVSSEVGKAVASIEKNPEELTIHIEQVLQAQTGSEFKDVRNLEVLKRLEDSVPEFARQAILRAEENTLQRFSKALTTIPEDERQDKFERYVEQVGGDETRHLEIFDRLKQVDNLPPEIAQKIEMAKDISARRFQNKFEHFEKKFDDQFRKRAMDRALSRFSKQAEDVGKVRVVEELNRRVKFTDEKIQQAMEQKRDESIEKFKKAFPDSEEDAERFRELSEQMAKNPDPTTFRLLQELEEKVKSDPKKREFIEQMEQRTKQEFLERAGQEQEKFFETIATSNPEDIQIFQQLKEEFTRNPRQFTRPEGGPPVFVKFNPALFDKGIAAQTGLVARQLEGIDNPGAFEQFQQKFQGVNAESLNEITRRRQDFQQVFKEKQLFVEEIEAQREEGINRSRIDDEFRMQFQASQNEEEQRALEVERDRRQQEVDERQFEKRKEFFKKNIELDPFCDVDCRREESTRFDQKIDQEKMRIREEDQFRQIQRGLRHFDEGQRRQLFDDKSKRNEQTTDEFHEPEEQFDEIDSEQTGPFRGVPERANPPQPAQFQERFRPADRSKFGPPERALESEQELKSELKSEFKEELKTKLIEGGSAEKFEPKFEPKTETFDPKPEFKSELMPEFKSEIKSENKNDFLPLLPNQPPTLEQPQLPLEQPQQQSPQP